MDVDNGKGEDGPAIVIESEEVKDDQSEGQLSYTDLVNLDNISAHNLYLGPEIRRLGTGSTFDSDVDSAEDSNPSGISSSICSTDEQEKVEIDYSALDRFGFIVLGEIEHVGTGSEEDKKFKKKQ